jgi:multicomponent Na+:H+ antiporter subunit C
MTLLVHVTVVWLFVVGIYGMVISRNLIHLVGCLNVAKSATAVFLISIGYRHGAIAPIRAEGEETALVVDPVVQALILIDIIVGAAVTALLLALAVQFFRRKGTLDTRFLWPHQEPDQGPDQGPNQGPKQGLERGPKQG